MANQKSEAVDKQSVKTQQCYKYKQEIFFVTCKEGDGFYGLKVQELAKKEGGKKFGCIYCTTSCKSGGLNQHIQNCKHNHKSKKGKNHMGEKS